MKYFLTLSSVPDIFSYLIFYIIFSFHSLWYIWSLLSNIYWLLEDSVALFSHVSYQFFVDMFLFVRIGISSIYWCVFMLVCICVHACAVYMCVESINLEPRKFCKIRKLKINKWVWKPEDQSLINSTHVKSQSQVFSIKWKTTYIQY